MIRRLILPLLTLMTVFVLTGCFQIKLETTIEKDGSGTTDLEIAVSRSITQAVAELAEMGGDLDVNVITIMNLDEKALIKDVKPYGVKVKNFKSATIEGKKTISLRLEFKDLKGMAFALGRISGEDDGSGFGIYDAGNRNLLLKEAMYEFPKVEKEELAESMEMPSDEVLDKQMEISGLIMDTQSEYRFVNVITVPGDIIETSAMETKGRTCTWTIDMETLMAEPDIMKPSIEFSGKGVKIEPIQP